MYFFPLEVTDQYGGCHSSDGDRRWSYYVFACEEYGNVCHNRDHFISPYSRHRRRQDRRHLSFKLDEVRTCIIERKMEEMTWIIKEGKGVRWNILENLIWWGEGDYHLAKVNDKYGMTQQSDLRKRGWTSSRRRWMRRYTHNQIRHVLTRMNVNYE